MAKETQELLNEFIQDSQNRGLTESTLRTYRSHLRHFVATFPDSPPWEWPRIERFLKKVIKKKDARPYIKRSLQAFYSYLERAEYGLSPIPRGRVGRPRKISSKSSSGTNEGNVSFDKLVRGGQGFLSELSSTSISTAEAIQDYLKSHGDLREWSVKTYLKHLTPFSQEFPELPLEPEPIEAHIYALQKKKHRGDHTDITPEYRAARYRIIKLLYNFLEKRHRLPVHPKWGVINPIKEISPPKIPRKLPASLTLDEFQQVINVATTDQELALLQLLAYTGLRAGEICSITRDRIGPDHIWVHGKTGQRQVSITPELGARLLSLSVNGGPIFRGQHGEPATTLDLYRLVRPLLEKAGIKKRHMGPHLFRHTFGRQSIIAGINLIALQHQMGHTDIKTTRIYSELAFDDIHREYSKKSPGLQLEFGLNGNGKGEHEQPVSQG